MKLTAKLEWVSQEQAEHWLEGAIMQMIVGVEQKHDMEMLEAYARHLKMMKERYLQWERYDWPEKEADA